MSKYCKTFIYTQTKTGMLPIYRKLEDTQGCEWVEGVFKLNFSLSETERVHLGIHKMKHYRRVTDRLTGLKTQEIKQP